MRPHKHSSSHTITQVGDYVLKYREEREPEIYEMLHSSPLQAVFPQPAVQVQDMYIHSFEMFPRSVES